MGLTSTYWFASPKSIDFVAPDVPAASLSSEVLLLLGLGSLSSLLLATCFFISTNLRHLEADPSNYFTAYLFISTSTEFINICMRNCCQLVANSLVLPVRVLVLARRGLWCDWVRWEQGAHCEAETGTSHRHFGPGCQGGPGRQERFRDVITNIHKCVFISSMDLYYSYQKCNT